MYKGRVYMKLIERRQYLNKLINVLGTPDIKVVTGVRRSGKSKLLEAFRTYVEKEIPDCNIIQINFNLPDYDDLLTYRALYDYVNEHYVAGRENFVFIDEVQMCKDFEKAVNGLHASEKYDIYITGSNAFLLSSDLATLFTGRTFEIKMYPREILRVRETYPGYVFCEEFENDGIDLEVFSKQEDNGNQSYIIYFYYGNEKYAVVGINDKDFLKEIAIKYQEAVVDNY